MPMKRQLEIAVSALRYIAKHDYGPAGANAQDALDNMESEGPMPPPDDDEDDDIEDEEWVDETDS